ncbi:MAG: VWA domain-containing protein, partial [Candidatus Aminicenantes bacterium]|nr:VWA domain-containing protein [Candidatus Aminicenantes bacterium]
YGLRKPDFTIYENGDKQEITSFLATKKGKFDAIDIVFLFDQTGSMGDEVTAVKNNALLFADILEESNINYRLAVINFSDRIEKKFDFTSDIKKFKNQVASIRVCCGGDYPENALEALKQASELKLRKNARTAFILVTDAPYHENNHVTELAMKPLVKRLALRDIQIYPIAIQLEEYLWIAKETNGAYFNILDDFSSIIEELAYGLTSQYRLRYITSNPCPDGSTMEVKLHISPIASSTTGEYKRPLNFNQLDLNFLYAAEDISIDPQKPIECSPVLIRASIQATSCSDSALIKNIIVRLYDVKPGERTEVARSEPLQLQSNGQARNALLEWNTSGYRGDRKLELVIDPGKILEKSKEDNIIRKNINVSEVAHDLYIESIEYTPNPVEPCDVVTLSVKANDGTDCKGLILHDIELGAFDGKKPIGKLVTSIKIGEPEAVVFEWDAAGTQEPKLLKFIVDPERKFKNELTRENNIKEVLINVKPAQHDLFPVSVTHAPQRPIVGDTVRFQVKIEDKGHCPEVPLGQNIHLRLSDAANRFILAESKPFTISTQNIALIPIEWKTRLKDHGTRELSFILDPQKKVRELTPPGKENNSIQYTVEIRPMPHDLIIKTASHAPKVLIDGDPATITVVVEDNARFPGVKLENVKIKAFERYSRALLGRSHPIEIFSRQTAKIEFPIDTGGMAGEREILIVVDPDNEIEELTPDDKDGENNNEYILKVKIQEGS